MGKALKVAWGIDPYNSYNEIDQKIELFLKNLQNVGNFEIDPIYVTSANNVIYTEYALPLAEDNITAAHRNVDEYLDSFSELNLSKSKVIETNSTFRSNEVKSFKDYVEENDYDFVVLAAHGRSGLKRFLLGSFTENFIVRCNVPTFVINLKTKSQYDLTKALAPIEIDEEAYYFSSELFKNEKLDFIKSLDFYHHIRSKDFDPEAWVPRFYQLPNHDYNYYANKAKEHAIEFLIELVDKSDTTKKVRFSVTKEYESLPDIVTNQINSMGSGLLVIKSNTGPNEFFFLSGLTKEMIRNSNVPVLIFPRKYKTDTKKSNAQTRRGAAQ